ncbi:MAG TPA: M23 family metallopeptidase [Limnochordia bacterium]|nr:M23 family metallopeptidase [Limnochordia bacterium]
MPKANEGKSRRRRSRAEVLGAYIAQLYRRASAKVRVWPAPARRAIVGGAAVVVVVAALSIGGGTFVHGLLNWELNRFSGVDLAQRNSAAPKETPLVSTPSADSVPAPATETGLQRTTPAPAAVANEPAPTAGAAPAPATAQSPAAQPAAAKVDLSRLYWPLAGSIVQQTGWVRDPITKVWRYQPGVIVRGKPGDTVHAALPGKVVAVGIDERGVPQVAVDDGDTWRTVYTGAFAASVKVGQQLAAGDPLGRLQQATGAAEQVQDPTGETLGAWVQFEITHAGEAIDPTPYAPQGTPAAG